MIPLFRFTVVALAMLITVMANASEGSRPVFWRWKRKAIGVAEEPLQLK